MNKYLIRNDDGEDIVVVPISTTYRNNGTLAILLYDDSNNYLCDVTVNLTGISAPNTNCAFIDTNNSPWLIDFINTYQLGVPTGRTCRSGYCSYPEYRFDVDKLNQEN